MHSNLFDSRVYQLFGLISIHHGLVHLSIIDNIIFLQKIFIGNQQNYTMNSRSERHNEYSDSRTDTKLQKEDNKQDVSSLKYIHVICIVHYWIRSKCSAYVPFQ